MSDFDSVKMRLKNCPWCSVIPSFLQDDKGILIACTNENCKVKPLAGNFETREQGLESWNNPQKTSERKFTETDLRQIFAETFVDEATWKYFFPDQEIYSTL